MRSLFVLAYTCSGLMQVFAQQLPPDSSIKQINLHDVVVMAADSSLSEAFTFYRTGKLSSTEDILSRMEGVNLTKRGAFGMEPMLRAYSAGQIK
jgi:iron complex outermembrane receptor protein